MNLIEKIKTATIICVAGAMIGMGSLSSCVDYICSKYHDGDGVAGLLCR